MILFPNCKINLGLHILHRRPDGYHDLCTAMVPVPWCDILEIVPAAGMETTFTLTGSTLGGCPPEKNLVIKALRTLEDYLGTPLPPMDIHLHKVVPDGAGLGGGSSDAAFAIKGANTLFDLGIEDATLAAVAARVGADCPFFIYNTPMLATGIGEILEPVSLPQLAGKGLLIAKPEAQAVSTREAYAGVTPRERPCGMLARALKAPVEEWMAQGVVSNDFEESIFALRPVIADLKEKIMDGGAQYAAMTGSGAAVVGIFQDVKMAEKIAATLTACQTFTAAL